MKVLLGAADRKRYGLSDEPLDVDLSVVMQHEAEELDDNGIDPDAWVEFINSGNVKVWRCVVWLALTRNGAAVALADTRFDRRSVRYTPAESPGKDGSDSASETSDDSTKPPSSDGSG